jgi:hypothetical protein
MDTNAPAACLLVRSVVALSVFLSDSSLKSSSSSVPVHLLAIAAWPTNRVEEEDTGRGWMLRWGRPIRLGAAAPTGVAGPPRGGTSGGGGYSA